MPHHADVFEAAAGGPLLRAVEAAARQLAEEVGPGRPGVRDPGVPRPPAAPCPSSSAPWAPPSMRASTAAKVLRGLVHDLYCTHCGVGSGLEHLLLLLLPGEETEEDAVQGQGEGDEAGAGPPRGLRAAASVAVALGRLLWRCEGRLAVVLAECGEGGEGDATGPALSHGDAALVLLVGISEAFTRDYRAVCSVHASDGAFEVRAEEEVAEAAQGAAEGAGVAGPQVQQQPQQEGQEREVQEREWEGQEGQEEELQGVVQDPVMLRRRAWVWAYGAWRWLPALSCLAAHTASAGNVPRGTCHAASLPWIPVLMWVKRVCLACLGAGDGQEGPGEVAAGWEGAADAGGLAGTSAADVRGTRVQSDCHLSSSRSGGRGCGGCRRGGRLCGCWRDFLLVDVGAVELLGAALEGVVPGLLRRVQEERGEGRGEGQGLPEVHDLLWLVGAACMLLAAAFPEEVGRAAWDPPVVRGPRPRRTPPCGTGSGSGGGVCGNVTWDPASLEAVGESVAGYLGAEGGGEHFAAALRVVAEWGRECVRAGRREGLGAEQLAALRGAVDKLWSPGAALRGGGDGVPVPPLCQLRALLPGLCSNPRCVVLPPPGQTEAEAGTGEGAGRLLEACSRGCGAAWYCSARCREEHWWLGHRELCGGPGAAAASAATPC